MGRGDKGFSKSSRDNKRDIYRNDQSSYNKSKDFNRPRQGEFKQYNPMDNPKGFNDYKSNKEEMGHYRKNDDNDGSFGNRYNRYGHKDNQQGFRDNRKNSRDGREY